MILPSPDSKVSWSYFGRGNMIFALSLILLSTVFNVFVSGMGGSGIALNLISLVLLGFVLSRFEQKRLSIFVVFSSIFGPFLFVNLGDIGFKGLGRLEYFLGFIFLLYTIFLAKSLHVLLLALVSFLVASLSFNVFFVSSPVYSELHRADQWYTNFSKVGFGLLLAWMLSKKETKIGSIGFLFLSFPLALHILFSIVQLHTPISIRAGAIEASLSLGPLTLNRPVGMLETAFTYGMTTLAIWFVIYIFSQNHYRRAVLVGLYLLIPISILSTRSVAIGVLLFVCLWVWQSGSMIARVALFACGLAVAAVLVILGVEIATYADASNATKVILWFLVFEDWMSNLWSFETLFGYGPDTAALIAKTGGFGELVNLLGVSYDNNVDSLDAFRIHNVFLQILYEYGLLVFLVFFTMVATGLKRAFSGDLSGPALFLWCIAFTNYFLHNGMFSPWLICFLCIGCGIQLKGGRCDA